ncbi:MAG: hypothetical protein LUD22_04310 [Coprobacillus sp.]|nr:hypothetical protein [Coprobacillus sp.]
MKKTKLLTSIAALALVVGLGACETGDIYVNVEVGGDDSSDTESGTTDEGETTDTTESGEGDESSGETGGEEDQLAKDLEAFQETLKDLGDDLFSEWEAYQYKLDDTTRLIKADENGYPFGYYRAAEDEVSYYVDGQVYYSGYDDSYETYELTKTYKTQLEEDDAFIELETLLSLTSEDVLSLTQEDDTYSISYQFVKEGVLTGTTTSTYKLGLTINEDKLVKATCDYLEVFEAGSYGTDSEEEKSESIEKIDPDTITQELLVEDGFDANLWVKETGPVLLGTFDWTGFTDGDNSTSNVTLALTVAQLEDNLSRAWQPEDVFTNHSYSVTSTSNMRAGSHNNVSGCDLVGSLECITFGNGRSTTGSMVLTFDESVNITKVEVVDVLGSTTSNNLTVNGQAKAGYDYRNVTNWNSGAKWEDVPAVVYDDIEQGNTLSMSLTQSASADKVIVHSIAIYGEVA